MVKVKKPLVLVVDTREQKPYEYPDMIVEKLDEGDYSIQGYEHEFAIERKSLADWAGSITSGRERVEKEIIRAKKNLKYFAFIIEMDMKSVWKKRLYSKVPKSSLVNTALFWSVKYNIPFFFVSTRTQGKYAVKNLARAYIRYKEEGLLHG